MVRDREAREDGESDAPTKVERVEAEVHAELDNLPAGIVAKLQKMLEIAGIGPFTTLFRTLRSIIAVVADSFYESLTKISLLISLGTGVFGDLIGMGLGEERKGMFHAATRKIYDLGAGSYSMAEKVAKRFINKVAGHTKVLLALASMVTVTAVLYLCAAKDRVANFEQAFIYAFHTMEYSLASLVASGGVKGAVASIVHSMYSAASKISINHIVYQIGGTLDTLLSRCRKEVPVQWPRDAKRQPGGPGRSCEFGRPKKAYVMINDQKHWLVLVDGRNLHDKLKGPWKSLEGFLKIFSTSLGEVMEGVDMCECKWFEDKCRDYLVRYRSSMPQLDNNRQAAVPGVLLNFSNSNLAAKMQQDIKYVFRKDMPVTNYTPTQGEILLAKALIKAADHREGQFYDVETRTLASTRPITTKPLIEGINGYVIDVSQDNFVIDGHHSWAAQMLRNEVGLGESINVVQWKMSIASILAYAKSVVLHQHRVHRGAETLDMEGKAVSTYDKPRLMPCVYCGPQDITIQRPCQSENGQTVCRYPG